MRFLLRRAMLQCKRANVAYWLALLHVSRSGQSGRRPLLYLGEICGGFEFTVIKVQNPETDSLHLHHQQSMNTNSFACESQR
jgi:hypothetical protein